MFNENIVITINYTNDNYHHLLVNFIVDIEKFYLIIRSKMD